MAGAIAKVIGIPLESVENAVRVVFKGKNAVSNLEAARDAYNTATKVKGGA
jgi:Pyruvate/2-oxoacid:ferredoxin oxidoreductase gamma subunit